MYKVLAWLRGNKNKNTTVTSELPVSSSTTAFNQALLPVISDVVMSQNDALSQLQRELTLLQTIFEKKTHLWQQREKIILANSATSINTVRKDYSDFRKVITNFISDLKALVISAEWALHNVLEQTQPHIVTLCAELNAACDALSSAHKSKLSPKEIEGYRLTICAHSISIFLELTELIKDVLKEINLCLNFEQMGEKIALALAEFIITLLTHIPFPTIKFSMNDLYRQYLVSEVKYETVKIEQLLKNTELEIENAEKIFNETEMSMMSSLNEDQHRALTYISP